MNRNMDKYVRQIMKLYKLTMNDIVRIEEKASLRGMDFCVLTVLDGNTFASDGEPVSLTEFFSNFQIQNLVSWIPDELTIAFQRAVYEVRNNAVDNAEIWVALYSHLKDIMLKEV